MEGCGASRLNPICGVFAVGLAHARISENRIHGNGMRLEQEGLAVLLGQRGGIVIRYVQPSVPGLGIVEQPQVTTHVPAPQFRIQSGGEALLLHENQVSAPEGRALEINGVGGMSINDNQLASLGASAASLLWLVVSAGAAPAPGQAEMFALDPFPAIMGNAVVSVVNMGISNDIGLAAGIGGVLGVSSAGDVTTNVPTITTGRLLFANNQTRYDGLAAAPTLVPCLVGLASLDDAKMVGNQCDADFIRGMRDFAFTHGLVIGITMQMTDNRFSEPSMNSDGVGQLSGLCLGMSVLMHHNFGSHCFLGLPISPAMSLLVPNRSIVLNCERNERPTLNLFGDMLGGANRVRNIRASEMTIDERYTYRRSAYDG